MEVKSEDTWIVRPERDLEDLIPDFLRNRRSDFIEMEAASSRHDYETICRLAHIWKGVSRPYGFTHLEEMSRELERAAEAKNHPKVEDLLLLIKKYLTHVRVVLS